jgi:hypothetical protein
MASERTPPRLSLNHFDYKIDQRLNWGKDQLLAKSVTFKSLRLPIGPQSAEIS